MKQYFSIALVLFFLSSPLSSFANTLPAGDTDPNTNSTCADLTYNLRFGMRDSGSSTDIATLQDFLQSKGYTVTSAVGFFGRSTRTAVKAFQQANGLRPSGYVGAVTRAKIKEVDCGTNPSPVQAMINLGQQTYVRNNTTYTIAGTNATFSMNGTFSLPCPPAQGICQGPLQVVYEVKIGNGVGDDMDFKYNDTTYDTAERPFLYSVAASTYKDGAMVTITKNGSVSINTSSSSCTATTNPSIVVTSPTVNASYVAGQKVAVTWTSCNVRSVYLGSGVGGHDLGLLNQTQAIPASQGSYQWTVPAGVSSAYGNTGYFISVESVSATPFVSVRSGAFSIY